MWKILGLVVLCGLLSRSEGKPYANRACTSSPEIGKAFGNAFVGNELLLNHLKGIPLSDVPFGGLLGVVNGITGLSILNIEINGINQALVQSRAGVELQISATLELGGHTVLNPLNLIKAKLRVTFGIGFSFANFLNGAFDCVIYNCAADFGEIEVSALGIASNSDLRLVRNVLLWLPENNRAAWPTLRSTLPTSVIDSLKSSLIADINLKICGVLQIVLNLAKGALFDNINVPLPLGPYGNLRCALARLPTVYPTHIAVDLFIDVQSFAEGLISISDSASQISEPPLDIFRHVQAFHPILIDLVLGVFVQKETQELTCTAGDFSGADNLKNAILALVSAENHANVAAALLSIQISVEVKPKTVFGSDGISIYVDLKISFFIKSNDGSIFSVLVVRSRVRLSAALTFVNGRIIFDLSFYGNALVLISSGAGIVDVSTLEPHCGNLVKEVFLPTFNGNVHVGIPTPTIFGVAMINPVFKIIEGAPVACI